MPKLALLLILSICEKPDTHNTFFPKLKHKMTKMTILPMLTICEKL